MDSIHAHSTGEAAVPLLELDDARIESAGGPLWDGISCRGYGSRIGLVGPWDALFRLLGGSGHLAAGSGRINGEDISSAVASGRVGVALQDVPFPPRWKGQDYLVQSGRLSGRVGSAESRSQSVVAQLGLARLAGRRLQVMAPVERRAVLIAHAVMSDPATLAIQAPLDDLDSASASSLAAVLEQAASGRKLLVSVRDTAAGSPPRELLDAMDTVLSLSPEGEVTELGANSVSAARGKRYLVSVPRLAGAFCTELTQRGVDVLQVDTVGPGPATVARRNLGDHAARLLVRLKEGLDTDVLLDAAIALHLPILHLAPAELPGATGESSKEKCY